MKCSFAKNSRKKNFAECQKNIEKERVMSSDENGTALSFYGYIEIHPNAFATELTRMIAAKIGQRYLIMNWKMAFRLNGWPPSVTSFSIFSTL